MTTFNRTLVTAIILALGSLYAQQADYAGAIGYGSSFKTRVQFLEKGMKNRKIQLASAWAADGMSKYVTFFTDYDAIAAAAAQAKMEMREFTVEDAKNVPLSGLIFAHVEVHARGMIPVAKLNKRYIRNAAHLVLQVDGKVIQPLKRELSSVTDTSVVVPVAFYTYWQTNNFSILTGGPLGVEGEKAEMEFAFAVDPSIRTKRGRVILIDADGHRHEGEVDFARVFK